MKDRKKLQHIHSSIADKQPTPQSLEVGEIAVNNSANKEFLSLKNSNDKVIRFSSDEQLISWMEKKEVIPYAGYVRGDGGPESTSGDSPTADSMGSYGISNDDLLNNTSEIVIKFNQVVAGKTAKHEMVNSSKDRYDEDVNPTIDSGLTDGAGLFIDMSRYAMRGSNPSFSSLTVTDKTDLSGNTTITDGDGTGTRTGNTFTIKVTNENETVSVLNESATTRATSIGTENLNVSGTTTEVHTGDVTISNKANVTTTTDGNETKTINGDFYLNVPNLNISADTFINGNVCITGTVTATGAIYSSDRNLKENIKFVEREDINKVKNIFTKSFNFKGDDTKRKVYGVIAQEVQDAGLNELVHTKDDGTLAVDYTSLLILKTAYLEDFCAMLNGKIVELEKEIKNLKDKK